MIRLPSLLLCATLGTSLCLAQSSIQDTSCLSPTQVDALLKRYEKVRNMFGTDGLIADLREKERQRDELLAPAVDCATRLSSVFTKFQAELEGCRNKVQTYNNANTLMNIARKRLQEEQEILLRALQIERTQFPACSR